MPDAAVELLVAARKQADRALLLLTEEDFGSLGAQLTREAVSGLIEAAAARRGDLAERRVA